MEPNDKFQRRAFRAAGPVFLVAIGAVVLTVLAIAALVSALPTTAAGALFVAGAGALVAGLAWGAAQGKRTETR